MALSLTTETSFGIKVDDAYYRVEGVSLLSKTSMSFRVRGYADPELAHFSDGAYECSYELESENPIKQAYIYLKTLPEFEGAVDC